MRYLVPNVVSCYREHEVHPSRTEHVPVQPVEGPLRAQVSLLHLGGPVSEPVALLAPYVRAFPLDRLCRVHVEADRLHEDGPVEPLRVISQELECVARPDARAQDVTPLDADVIEQGYLIVAKGFPSDVVIVGQPLIATRRYLSGESRVNGFQTLRGSLHILADERMPPRARRRTGIPSCLP